MGMRWQHESYMSVQHQLHFRRGSLGCASAGTKQEEGTIQADVSHACPDVGSCACSDRRHSGSTQQRYCQTEQD